MAYILAMTHQTKEDDSLLYGKCEGLIKQPGHHGGPSSDE